MNAGTDVVLGIDAGTGGLRAALFDLAGTLLGIADRGYLTTYPQPGWAEQSPQTWWDALVGAVRDVITTSGIDARRVIGLAVDSPCDILLASRDGTPLTDALMWMDLRGAEQARRLTETGAPVLRYCGGVVPAEWPLPKTLWLKEHAADVWSGADRLVEQMTWLTWRLTGEWVAPLNSAAAKWHYRGAWPHELMHDVGLDDALEKLPHTVVPMGGRGGDLSPAAAELLGLRAGIAVAMTGIDAHVGMAGIDVLAPGSLALITGTSTCQMAQSQIAVFDDGLWGPFEDAVVGNEWTIEAGQASTGGTVRWLLDLVGGRWNADERYARADEAAAAAGPGAEGLTLLDYWQGSRTPVRDPAARGTIWGLTSSHGAGHLLRAVYEGTAYGNKRILDTLAKVGVPTQRIVACGGGVRSRLWLQILADVAGIPIELTTVDDAVALGSAICAAVAAGAFPNLPSAAAGMVRRADRIEPNPALRGVYAEGYALYVATYDALAPLYARRARFAEASARNPADPQAAIARTNP
jgi:FGGY-family pentulose kinase